MTRDYAVEDCGRDSMDVRFGIGEIVKYCCKKHREQMKLEGEPRYSVAELEKIHNNEYFGIVTCEGVTEDISKFIDFLKDKKKVQEILK